MKKILVIVFAILLQTTSLISGEIFMDSLNDRGFIHTYSDKKCNKFQANELPRNYDVLSYDISVDWTEILPSTSAEPEKRKWNGNIRIVLTPLENNISYIELDAVQLQINSAFLNGESIELSSDASGLLSINFDYPISMGDTISVEIDYTYNNPENRGFSHRNTPYIPDNILPDVDLPSACTLSETVDARYWYPCNDRPGDKAIFTSTITVPFGMKAASNGCLDTQFVNYDSELEAVSETFVWSNKYPMPPYLFTIAASEYELKIERMQISNNSEDSIDVYYYYWPGDWDGTQYKVGRMLMPTQKTMLIFSDLFGDYPFEKYGVLTADHSYMGYKSLGMEHQTLASVSRSWFNWYNVPLEFTSFAHELGHHWFGNKVTCNTWKDIWFNEGGASWLEALYIERIYDEVRPELYYNKMINFRRTYLRYADSTLELFRIPIYGLDDQTGIFDYSWLVYSKAAWIYHHLREIAGENIYSLFRGLLTKYEYSNISTEQYIDYFVENISNPPLGLDLRRFLEQWIYSAGHPQFEVISQSKLVNIGKWEVDLHLKQTQVEGIDTPAPKVPVVFHTFVDILFYNAQGIEIYRERVLNTEREQVYHFTLDSAVSSVLLDTTTSLLEIIYANHTDIDENSSFQNINVFPNPANHTTTITLNVVKPSNLKISLYNAIEQEVLQIFDGFTTAGDFIKTFQLQILQLVRII